MMVRVAHPPISDALWEVALAWLQPAIVRGGETDAAELRAMVEASEAQLWTAWGDGVCHATLATTRSGDTLHLWLCGGHGCDWARLLRQIMNFARGQGVTRWSVDGRKGWTRVLKESA